MALTNDILNDFFSGPKPKKSFTIFSSPNPSKKNTSIDEGSSTLKQQYKNYRVFDDPPKQETNLGQTQDKVETNSRQTQDKVETKPKLNLRQGKETPDKVKTELKTELKTNLGQSWDKVETKINFSSLVGLQRNIVLFLYEICKASRDKTTCSLSIEHISSSCKTTKSSAQKTIQRLEKKHILKRSEFKNGRSGWTRYELPEWIYQEILHNETQDKLKTNIGQTWDKLGTEPKTELRTSPSSSSGYNILNTTTTGDPDKPRQGILSEEWLKIDIGSLSNIGFTMTHLIQIASQNKLTASVVQDSIHAFAFDLQENDKAKSIKVDPINFFMGILRGGKPYAPSSNYESPQDKAMRVYRERMREIEQGRVDSEKEAIGLAFNEWFAKLTDEEKKEFLPELFRNNTNSEKLGKSKILESSARNHFEKEIWPDKKKEIVGEISYTEGLEVSNGQ